MGDRFCANCVLQKEGLRPHGSKVCHTILKAHRDLLSLGSQKCPYATSYRMKANQILSDFAYYKQFLPAEDFQNMGAAPAAAGKQADEEEASNPVTAVCATKAAPKTAPISAQPAVGAPRGSVR